MLLRQLRTFTTSYGSLVALGDLDFSSENLVNHALETAISLRAVRSTDNLCFVYPEIGTSLKSDWAQYFNCEDDTCQEITNISVLEDPKVLMTLSPIIVAVPRHFPGAFLSRFDQLPPEADFLVKARIVVSTREELAKRSSQCSDSAHAIPEHRREMPAPAFPASAA